MTSAPLLSADNLTVRRGGAAVLSGVSLGVEQNDFVTVVGPNGAGKTTLLKCMLGLTAPDSGTVRRAAGLKIGYVPQRLNPDYAVPMRARAFLALHKKVSAAAVCRAAEETGAEEFLARPLHALSGGELQRVLLARALLDSPGILALDEPGQNLDIAGQLAFYRLLSEVYLRRNISILMVSHDLHLVMSATRRVVCLYRHVCCSGAPQAVAQDPEFINLFGKDMSRLTAVYHHEHGHRHE